MARKNGFRITGLALASLTLAATSTPASAQSITDRFANILETVQEGLDVLWPDEWQDKGVKARIGAGFGWMPDYIGSDNYRFRVLPVIDVRYKNIWRLNGSTLTYNFYSHEGLEAGPLLNLRFGRDEMSNKALVGLGDIPTTLEAGAFVRYTSESMLVSTDIRQAFGAGQGLSVRATAGHGLLKHEDFALGAGVRAKWYSKKAMQTNYGVTEQQSANSARGIEVFEAGPGLSEISLNLIGAYRISDDTKLIGVASAGSLLGDAADSPLTGGGHGSATQMILGLAVTYQF